MTATQIKRFNTVEGLPETYQVENARQVLVFVADAKTPTAETAGHLQFLIKKVENPETGQSLTFNIDGNIFHVWEILEGRKFTDTVYFTWA